MSTLRRTFGVDEAGRGPILGPMAIAVVALESRQAGALCRAGVVDSKHFGAGPDACELRARLAEQIRSKAIACEVRLVEVEEIDHYTWRGQLNALERRVVTELLRELAVAHGDRIVCDGATLFSPLRALFPWLEARDHGESVHTAVAAASIVAKDARDRAFASIAARYQPEFGPIAGGGYLNAATRRFLDAYQARHGGLPPEARKSWGNKDAANLSLA
ncbi:MAG: hypothetical protein IPK74_07950 [Deltaproteobacteria bacterium]|nr:hypothetical protein [Deltaproteobacteria bacterium]